MLEISGSQSTEVATQARARSVTKLRAIDDAMKMRSAVSKECAEFNITPPPFTLLELIGKGSFGRVYKAASQTTGSLVAVKIINIEEGDRVAPGASDTFAEILKEVNTVKLLSASGAKNINAIIDTLLIGQSMWMVTEYCGGGSVATLMRPTGFLFEIWIIPILREVAEAIFWVHKQGIIHRDIKCANVLVAEDGGVQLCDFGVAGMIKSRCDKRKTVTGTLQWMAPELFAMEVSYGNEVDIWAFGSMAYEAATGLPPNASMPAMADMDLEQFGDHLRDSCPRLDGDQYSSQLKDLIAYCMSPNPTKRPRIENVQRHAYIFDTEQSRPTRGLAKLVAVYKKWESEGGNRKSLFCPGGAQGPTPEESYPIMDEEWDYGTMPDMVEVDMPFPEQTKPRRRHGKPLHVPVPVRKPPLEKAFDQNTMSNYHTNARRFYGAPSLPPCDDDTSKSQDWILPVMTSEPTSPAPTSTENHTTSGSTLHYRRTSPLSNRLSAISLIDLDASLDMSLLTPRSQPDIPITISEDPTPSCQETGPPSTSNRLSAVSPIDLDASLTLEVPSDAQSIASISPLCLDFTLDETVPSPPIISLPSPPTESFPILDDSFPSSSPISTSHYIREPSLYVPTLGIIMDSSNEEMMEGIDSPTIPGIVVEGGVGNDPRRGGTGRFPRLPALPAPPAEEAVLGFAGRETLRDELERLIGGMWEHLEYAEGVMEGLPVVLNREGNEGGREV
ncbi:kinase-like domain-containing protein [Podospora fimiseda]|uniref:non-specific serine/threonine protein kinase n=1 Tax=Podospora fimiseda TaxID=252190 RepID=A0AAN6YLC5_9PEZI|nr:kinase-like domain-containing protein [Podospora fimiseda]